MSVDSLYQQIVLSQREALERRRVLQEVKSEISNCRIKIMEVKEEIQTAKTSQEKKVTIVMEKRFQRDLLKKTQDGLEIQKENLLRNNRDLQSKLQEMKKEVSAEEETFMKEVQDYNNHYGILVDREELLRESAEAESQRLDEEAEVLEHEIESVRGKNLHVSSLQQQRSRIQREVSDVQEALRGLDKEISAAAGVTKSLDAEKLAVSQKPQSDGECLRLKKELEWYKSENLECVYEALRSEVAFLQNRCDLRSDDTGHDI